MITTTARNATLEDLHDLLVKQNAAKVDVVVPASKMRSVDGVLHIEGTEPVMDEDGVTTTTGQYRPTDICDAGIADKLGIPLTYLRKLRAGRIDLYDENVNRLLHGGTTGIWPYQYPASDKAYLVRCFRGDDGQGVARAFLSDKFRIVDNLDTLTAALQGVKLSGTQIEVTGCDLTERRMYVNVYAPDVSGLAPKLLEGYRPPSGRWSGLPTVFTGFQIRNSEVGDGRALVVPKLLIEVCTNGMTIEADAMGVRHLGGKLDEGVVDWSDETKAKQLELIKLQARDAVRKFLSPGYLEAQIEKIEAVADAPVTKAKDTVEHVAAELSFTEEETEGIFDHFIRGGQLTAGGVLNAVTSFSQTIKSADRAVEMDGLALRALELAAA